MAPNSDATETEAVRFARRILGISATATTRDIRVAFARRAKVVHPDRFDVVTQKEEWAEANVLLRELNEAYKLVISAAARSAKAPAPPAAATSSAAAPKPAPAPRRTYTPPPQRSHRSRVRDLESQRVPIGFADIGLFLVAGIFLFFGGNGGMLLFLAIFFGIDFWMRWHAGLLSGNVKQHMLLPRKGLSFVCTPMWIASLMVGIFGWIFPWRELGAATTHVAIATFVGLVLIAASFWYVDYTYEISRPD